MHEALLNNFSRYKLGWRHGSTKYCQMIREANKPKRLKFSIGLLLSGDSFDDIIFTDESTVKMQTSLGFSFRKIGQPKKMKAAPKHPYQVIKCIL